MKTDPVLREIRMFRDAHAREFNYELDLIVKDHQRFAEKLKKQGWKFARTARRRPASKNLAA